MLAPKSPSIDVSVQPGAQIETETAGTFLNVTPEAASVVASPETKAASANALGSTAVIAAPVSTTSARSFDPLTDAITRRTFCSKIAGIVPGWPVYAIASSEVVVLVQAVPDSAAAAMKAGRTA